MQTYYIKYIHGFSYYYYTQSLNVHEMNVRGINHSCLHELMDNIAKPERTQGQPLNFGKAKVHLNNTNKNYFKFVSICFISSSLQPYELGIILLVFKCSEIQKG